MVFHQHYRNLNCIKPTVDEINIDVHQKYEIFFCCTIELLIYPILLYCSPYCYCYFNFAKAKLSLLIIFFHFIYCFSLVYGFLYCSQNIYHSSTYSCRFFLKTTTKSKVSIMSIDFKNNNKKSNKENKELMPKIEQRR